MDLQQTYDEDLMQNKFFRKLQSEHKILIETAPLENWIICVPRSATISKDQLGNTDYLLAHILIPHDEVPEQYTNLLGTDIKQIHGKLCSRGIASRILFEELFYTKGLVKYKVWCIESPLLVSDTSLNGTTIDDDNIEPAGLLIVRDLNDAIDIIWKETNSKAVFRKIDSICNSFMKNTTHVNLTNGGASSSSPERNIDRLRNSVDILLNHCYKKLMYQRRLHEKCSTDPHFAKIFQIALETYMMSILYSWVFDAITVSYADQNEKFNKTLRNLSDMNQNYFKIDPKYNDVIGRVRTELLKINDFPTAIEKLSCLRRALTAASSSKHSEISVDDLIPILVFVIVKSNLAHWISTFQFLHKFIFTEMSDDFDKGADSFLVTTLEAAMHYIATLEIKSNTLTSKCITADSTNKSGDSEKRTASHNKRRHFSSKEDFVEYLFDQIKAEDEIEIIKLLKTDRDIDIKPNETADTGDDTGSADSGICNVEKRECGGAECNSMCTLSACRLNIRNGHGIGAVHITAMYGLAKMLNVLLALGIDPKATDENNYTALHYAASRGHQNTLLLLLHAGVDINAMTNDKYTPLHLCCLNGHENCVKALLYYSDHMRIRVDKNAQNRMGDTPLHLAAKWGFTEIVETLLEYGVKTDQANRLGHTPNDYAHNSYIVSLLQNIFVVIDHPVVDETTTWDTSSSKSLPETQEVFRGCILPGEEDKTSGSSTSGKTNNDKIVAAIRNRDTKLACYFLGIEMPEEIIATSCHPLCNCEKCVHINRVQAANQSRLNEQGNASLAPRRYIGNINEPSSIDGLTPLHAATQTGNLEIIEHCFKLGALVCQQSTVIRQTALHYAIQTKCHKTTELILNHIVDDTNDINIQDTDGNTALHIAVQIGQTQLVECLLAHEPILDIVNGAGQSAMDVAKSSLKLNIVRLLENANSNQMKICDETQSDNGLRN